MLNSPKKQPATLRHRMAVMIAAMCISGLGIGGISAMLFAPAHALTLVEPRTKIVRYHDLNLASDQGRNVLDRRISRAAKQVCDDVGINAVIHHRRIRACVKAAHKEAWSSVEKRMGSYQQATQLSN